MTHVKSTALLPVCVICLCSSAVAGERPDPYSPALPHTATKVSETAADGGFPVSAARDYILQAGYVGIGDLEQVNGLVWRGTAYKDGKAYAVVVDYTGTVVGSN